MPQSRSAAIHNVEKKNVIIYFGVVNVSKPLGSLSPVLHICDVGRENVKSEAEQNHDY